MAKRKQKWLQIQVKTIKYFETISIPGISRIVNTNSFALKILWTLLIAVIFALGFQNVSQAFTDYYQYDKITNVERVNPENVTFPAITICTGFGYNRDHYINGSLINDDYKYTNIRTDNITRFKNFLDLKSTNFYSAKLHALFNVESHLEFFKIPDNFDCFRFNGMDNQSHELFVATSSFDALNIKINHSYNEPISKNEYFKFNLHSMSFYVYVGDNYLNSFEDVEYILLYSSNNHDIELDRTSIEIKLPEPYNPCKESTSHEPYHQPNCIDSCVYRHFQDKYNCTLHLSLFKIPGLDQCVHIDSDFYPKCQKECPENCYSVDFTPSVISHKTSNPYTYFDFSFSDFGSLNITQIPKTDGFTFINNIGGGLGLFMGIAIPNLVEFVQFIVEIFSIALYP